MFAPGIDDAVFIGFAQATPTLFPFVECQTRLLGAYAVGQYRLPPEDEMRRVIDDDTRFYTGHMLDRPRHTQQLDHYLYEHNMRTKEIPQGRERAQRRGPQHWANVAESVTRDDVLQEAR
jgi:hypothetical protein